MGERYGFSTKLPTKKQCIYIYFYHWNKQKICCRYIVWDSYMYHEPFHSISFETFAAPLKGLKIEWNPSWFGRLRTRWIRCFCESLHQILFFIQMLYCDMSHLVVIIIMWLNSTKFTYVSHMTLFRKHVRFHLHVTLKKVSLSWASSAFIFVAKSPQAWLRFTGSSPRSPCRLETKEKDKGKS